jgi:hypothetical protein
MVMAPFHSPKDPSAGWSRKGPTVVLLPSVMLTETPSMKRSCEVTVRSCAEAQVEKAESAATTGRARASFITDVP